MDHIVKTFVHTAQRYPEIEKVVLFGSRARGDNQKNSDYDIAVYPARPSFRQSAKLCDEIDDMMTCGKIDLVIVGPALEKAFRQHIEREGIVLMERHNRRGRYLEAVARLKEALDECGSVSSDLLRDGVIQRFELAAELAWTACQEYLLEQGYTDINGPKQVMWEAFAQDVIADSDAWIIILNDRNLTSAAYEESTANEVFKRIQSDHVKQFLELADYFQKL